MYSLQRDSGNTKNLWQHAERHHPKLYRDLCTKKVQEKVKEGGAAGPTSRGLGPSAAGDKKQGQGSMTQFVVQRSLAPSERQRIDTALLRFIAVDMQPMSVVGDCGFLEYSKALNPSYEVPHRKTISKMLDENYAKVKADTMKVVSSLSSINLTCDMWMSSCREGYLTVTGHGQNFYFLYVVLETKCMSQSHTGDNMAKVITEVTEAWHIKDKVFTAVTDSHSLP